MVVSTSLPVPEHFTEGAGCPHSKVCCSEHVIVTLPSTVKLPFSICKPKGGMVNKQRQRQGVFPEHLQDSRVWQDMQSCEASRSMWVTFSFPSEPAAMASKEVFSRTSFMLLLAYSRLTCTAGTHIGAGASSIVYGAIGEACLPDLKSCGEGRSACMALHQIRHDHTSRQMWLGMPETLTSGLILPVQLWVQN